MVNRMFMALFLVWKLTLFFSVDDRDPVFIRKFKKKYGVEVWAEHVTTKKKKRLWRKKDDILGKRKTTESYKYSTAK